MQDIAEDCLI